MSKLKLWTEGDLQVFVSRRFKAPPEHVYRAHTDAALIQKWMLGPAGWTMPSCISDARPGGKMRFEWSNGQGRSFHLTGEYLELQPFRRIVHVERMHLPDPTPDNRIETILEKDGSGTLLTASMTLADAASRDAMLKTGMEHGMEDSFARLDEIAVEV